MPLLRRSRFRQLLPKAQAVAAELGVQLSTEEVYDAFAQAMNIAQEHPFRVMDVYRAWLLAHGRDIDLIECLREANRRHMPPDEYVLRKVRAIAAERSESLAPTDVVDGPPTDESR